MSAAITETGRNPGTGMFRYANISLFRRAHAWIRSAGIPYLFCEEFDAASICPGRRGFCVVTSGSHGV